MIHRPTMHRIAVVRAPIARAVIALAASSRHSDSVTDTPNLPARPARVGRVRSTGEAGATGRPAARLLHEPAPERGFAPSRKPMRRWLGLFLVAGSLVIARPAAAVDECASVAMTVAAQVSTDPGFEGLYRYRVTGVWDISRYGLGHIDFFLALENLACICDPRIVQFPASAGTSSGVNASGSCVVQYTGRYNCLGDPSIPVELRAPTVKFDAVDASCETSPTGIGTWTFYSPFPPAPFSVYPGGVAIKHGQQVCTGALAGQMPMGDCSTPARASSWGGVKAIYR